MKSVGFASIISMILSSFVTAAPSELPSRDISRTQAQGNIFVAKLSKNVYRTEEYQDNYTVSVPYEEQETYYESVPYQDYERVCHDETSWRQECRNQEICNFSVSSIPGIATLVPGCENGTKECYPGNNPPSPPPPPPPPRQCRTERICHQVPEHRQECRMEYVTKYRQERRTRTVTRYRDETRCCVTKTRSVFDHQIAADLQLNFPAEATLEANEKESFKASLRSDGTLKISPLKTIYSYEPLISDLGSRKFDVQMKLVPTYQPEQLGIKSISKLALVVVGHKSRLQFTDAGAVNKTRTRYALQLVDTATGNVLIEEARDNLTAAQRISWDLNVASTAGKSVALRMAVSRDGIVIAAPVAFEVQTNLVVKREASYDPSPYTRSSKIHHFRIRGKNDGIIVVFRDDTKVIDEVSTEYRLGIFVQEGKSGRLLAEKTFPRESLKVEKNGDIRLSLSDTFGVSAEELARLNPGKVIALSGEAIRYGSRFKGMKATVAFKAKLTVPKK